MVRYRLALFLLLAAAPAWATETIVESEEDAPIATEPVAPVEHAVGAGGAPASPFQLIGVEVEPGTRRTVLWSSPQAPGGFAVPTPVIVINGVEVGPVLCITAAIHGDELNGIEIARRVLHGLDPKALKGVVVGVPIVNLEGFWRRDRYIGDRRDLNRYFPGSPDGAYPSRVAHALFTDIILRCDAVVDLHTGSFYRENLPQVRADLTIKEIADLSGHFGAITVLQNIAPAGSLRGAATAASIPTVVMEIGGPLSLEPEKVALGVRSLRRLMESTGMTDPSGRVANPQPVYYGSEWVRADVGGIFVSAVALGEKVQTGQQIAEIIDPVSNTTYKVVAPYPGTVLGRAQNQFVSPGFALYRFGFEQTVEELEEMGEEEKKAVIEWQAEQLGLDPDTVADGN